MQDWKGKLPRLLDALEADLLAADAAEIAALLGETGLTVAAATSELQAIFRGVYRRGDEAADDDGRPAGQTGCARSADPPK